jgi:hypothetical protein
MNLSFFEWVKSRIKQAVHEGFAEAAAEIDPDDAPQAPTALPAALLRRLSGPVAVSGNGHTKKGGTR